MFVVLVARSSTFQNIQLLVYVRPERGAYIANTIIVIEESVASIWCGTAVAWYLQACKS